MILSDDIAWISINMRGTVANVEIRESLPTPREEIDGVSNLVADRDGVVERLEEVRGYQAVNIGDKVRRGQLLVGGIMGDEGTDIGLMAAKGRVYARCEETVEVTAPRKTVRKRYEGEVKYEKYLIFFKKEIKFFTNYRNSPTTCDKIDTVEYLRAPDGSRLPIGIRTVRYMEYTQEETERSDAELNEIADYMLAAELTALLADGELLSRSVERELDEEECRIVCRITCVRNIAQRKEIEISEDG
jgi:similar to stage IV sporulation protein